MDSKNFKRGRKNDIRDCDVLDHRSNRIRAISGRIHGLLNRYKGRLLVADEHPVVVEGNWDRDKVVMLSFPGEADFRDFADSPEYQRISKDRRAGTNGFVVLVRGVPEHR